MNRRLSEINWVCFQKSSLDKTDGMVQTYMKIRDLDTIDVHDTKGSMIFDFRIVAIFTNQGTLHFIYDEVIV